MLQHKLHFPSGEELSAYRRFLSGSPCCLLLNADQLVFALSQQRLHLHLPSNTDLASTIYQGLVQTKSGTVAKTPVPTSGFGGSHKRRDQTSSVNDWSAM